MNIYFWLRFSVRHSPAVKTVEPAISERAGPEGVVTLGVTLLMGHLSAHLSRIEIRLF